MSQWARVALRYHKVRAEGQRRSNQAAITRTKNCPWRLRLDSCRTPMGESRTKISQGQSRGSEAELNMNRQVQADSKSDHSWVATTRARHTTRAIYKIQANSIGNHGRSDKCQWQANFSGVCHWVATECCSKENCQSYTEPDNPLGLWWQSKNSSRPV